MTATVFTPPSGPRSVIRPGDAGSSLLGAFGERPIARIDTGGALQLLSSKWTLDFWIAAEDRLHTPASDSAVRQGRMGPGPVIRTAVRVPGGDIVQRAWVAPLSQGSGVVVEFENETATPVGLALSVRPFDLEGARSSPQVTLASDRIDLPDATIWLSSEHRDTIPELDAVVIPLPHKATVRIVIAESDASFSPDRPLPSAGDAVRGWEALVTSKTRVTLPDDGMTTLFDRSRGRLSLSTHDLALRVAAIEPDAGDELVALCLGGMERDAVEVVRALLADLWTPPRLKRNADPQPLAAVLDGIAWTIAMYTPTWAEEFLPAAIQIASSIARRDGGPLRDRVHSALARITASTRVNLP